MHNSTLLITRPFFDKVTNYLYHWSLPLIDLAKKKGFNVVDLKNKRANRNVVTSVLKKRKPQLVVFNGHGNAFEIGGQDNEVIIDSKNVDALKNKIVYARSCKSGNHLGKECIGNGVETFIGYTEDFVLLRSKKNTTKPLTDTIAKMFLEPSNAIPLSLIKGHTAEEAHTKALEMSKQTIQNIPVNNPKDSYLVPFLVWNMACQVCLGNKSAHL